MSTKRVIALVFLFSTFTALPALADQCSSNQRLPLPKCASAVYKNGVTITNNCSYKVTVKVDIANGSDKLININPRTQATVTTSKRLKVNCCPIYSQCAGR